MNIKKWFGNLLLGVCLLTFVTMLCGFSGGGVSCNSKQCLRYEFGAEKNSSYVAYESGEGTEQTLTVYVPLGQDTQILLKAVLTPEEGFSLDDIIKDYYEEEISWKFSADNGMPAGLLLGESDMAVQETENHVVVTAVVTVPSQTVKKSFDPATITLKNDGGTTLDADSMQLKVTAMDMTCALCGGQVQQDGTYAHKTCEVCGSVCDGTTYEHKACGVCGGLCDGTAYVHKACEICGGLCNGTAYEHKACEVCGGICNGTAYEHKACEICGGVCNGTVYAHKACEICGGLCNGTAYEHKACEICGGLCDGTGYVHKACEICGGLCDGTGYAHKACEICGGLCDGTAYAHKACEICGGLCDGTAYAHKACEICGGLCDGTSSGGTTSDGAASSGTASAEKVSTQTAGDKAVATGDSAPIALHGVLALTAGLAMVLGIFHRRKSVKAEK